MRKRLPGYLPSAEDFHLGKALWNCVRDFANLEDISKRWMSDGGCPAALEDLKP